MTTHLISRVFIVWSSSRGGKWLEDIFFNKEKAIDYVERMKKALKETPTKTKWKIEEKVTGDYIIFDDMWEDNK